MQAKSEARAVEQLRQFVRDRFGISISPEKREMLEAKITRAMTGCGVSAPEELLKLVKANDAKAIAVLASSATTNKTDFFREAQHFRYIRNNWPTIVEANPRIARTKEVRIWSAGCSTGQEPYTLAMVFKRHLASVVEPRILATDISQKVLGIAQRGVYPHSIREEMEAGYLEKFFLQGTEGYAILPNLAELVTFRLFNLMDDFPFSGQFDMIFCRNVMIYFDKLVQERLVEKFSRALTSGGLLFVGHSESLAHTRVPLRYVEPTIYMMK